MKRKTRLKQSSPPRRKKPFVNQPRASLKEIRTDLVERCCGKKTWATREAAATALNRIVLISSEEKHPQRVYECRKGNWHLTSKPDRYAPGADGEPIPGAARPVTPARKATFLTVARWKYTGPPDDARALLIARSRGMCEIGVLCGGGAQGTDPSHRIAKGMGGTSLASVNAVTAILWACRADHDFVESHPAEAYAAGWKVRHGAVDPANVPVMIAGIGGGITVYLTTSGEYSSAPGVLDGA